VVLHQQGQKQTNKQASKALIDPKQGVGGSLRLLVLL
jgi:hypothetical protein